MIARVAEAVVNVMLAEGPTEANVALTSSVDACALSAANVIAWRLHQAIPIGV